jgi:hypothetical protein
MLAENGAGTVRLAIDDVTERAASISRASDMLVHDRVDELTQVFVEMVAAVAETLEGIKPRSQPGQGSHPSESAEPGAL